MNKLSGCIVGVFVLGATSAMAADGDALFSKLDADKDGYVSTFEAQADSRVLEQFNRLDADGDGRLTKGEFAAYEAMEQ